MKLLQITKTDFVGRSRVRATAAALAWTSGAAALAMGVTPPAHAQQVNASLRGRITAEGGVSQVTAVNVDNGLTRTVATGADGRYQFASLPPGTYRLEVTTPSGVRRTGEFQLLVAQDAALDFDLSAPEIAEAGEDAIVITGNRIRTMEGGEVGVSDLLRCLAILQTGRRQVIDRLVRYSIGGEDIVGHAVGVGIVEHRAADGLTEGWATSSVIGYHVQGASQSRGRKLVEIGLDVVDPAIAVIGVIGPGRAEVAL